MSNNKSFVIKNGLSAKRYLQSSTAVSASDVDLSTGSYFTKTLSANTTFTFSNPPTSGKATGFALEGTGSDVTVGYDLANASYDSVYGTLSYDPYDMHFNDDGTKLYIADYTNTIREYNLSTAYDASTLSYNQGKNISAQITWVLAIAFSPDGQTMFAMGDLENKIFQYSLSTAWDISTASYASKSLDYSSQFNGEYGFTLGNSGYNLYGYNVGDDIIYQYSMTTAYDLSTASYDSKNIDLTSTDTSLVHVKFNADGTKMYTLGAAGQSVYQHTLSTAWDVSTASYDSVSFSHASQSTNAPSFTFNADGTKMYLGDDTNNRVYQYTIGTTSPATTTWPSSVKWSGATAPDAPASGEKDVYVFVTTDGGTTYYGKQAGDAVA